MLKKRIETIIKEEKRLNGALVGINIASAETGDTIYSRMDDIRLHPASNMKLLSGAAALQRLGEDYTYETTVAYDGTLTDGVLHGNVYIKGGGDPALLVKDIESFAEAFKDAGISSITGDLVIDDFRYDDVRLSPDLIWSDQPYYYAAQVSALNVSPDEDYDTGTVAVTIEPANEVGGKPMLTCYPNTAYVSITNDIVTGEKLDTPLEDSEIDIDRAHGTNKIVLSGTIPLEGEAETLHLSVWEPSYYVGTLLKESLEKRGLSFAGTIVRKEMPTDIEIVATKESITLKEIMVPFMKLSNNGHGEMFVKELGKVERDIGNWEEGIEVLLEQLKALGVDPELVDIRDGSGLSQATTVPAGVFSTFLFNIQSAPWFQGFYDSLPIAGEEDKMVGGTMRKRLKGYDVFAKTGSISCVSTVSGYLTTKAGEKLIFSIMQNNFHSRDEDNIKDIEDTLIECIANHK